SLIGLRVALQGNRQDTDGVEPLLDDLHPSNVTDASGNVIYSHQTCSVGSDEVVACASDDFSERGHSIPRCILIGTAIEADEIAGPKADEGHLEVPEASRDQFVEFARAIHRIRN